MTSNSLKIWLLRLASFISTHFFPAVVPCTTITRSVNATLPSAAAHVAAKKAVQEQDKGDEEVQLLSVSSVSRPSIRLEQLGCVHHTVNGDGNCLFYAIAHQAGFIGQDCRGDLFVADQLRTLALISMQKYPEIHVEEGMTVHQWDQKKLQIVQSAHWGGDLEIHLLAIGIQRDILVICGSGNRFTSSRRFPCRPPPIPKMRGGIFIAVNVTELSTQWNHNLYLLFIMASIIMTQQHFLSRYCNSEHYLTLCN